MTVDFDALIAAAQDARAHAHAPHSGFAVGCALLAGGRIFLGANVESASFPVGICAERAAVAAAVVAGERSVEAVAIAAERPVVPCGMCRQLLAEFNPRATIVSVGGGEERRWDLASLFPEPFSF